MLEMKITYYNRTDLNIYSLIVLLVGHLDDGLL